MPMPSPFSIPSFPPPKRNTPQNAQLPLPSTLNAPSPTRSHFAPSSPPSWPGTPQSATFNISSTPVTPPPPAPPRPRGMSILANRALGIGPSSPASPNFTTSPHSRSTHAGGIQPSVSFFRPSRPNHNEIHSRPSSVASSAEVTENVHDSENSYPLATIGRGGDGGDPQDTAEVTESGDGLTLEGEGASLQGEGSSKETESNRNLLSMGKLKQSREPLLPTSGRPGGLGATKVNAGLGISLSAAAACQQDNNNNGKRLSGVRNSIDRVFNLSRGLSIESIRRPGVGEGEGTGANDIEARLSPTKGRRTPREGSSNTAHVTSRSSVSPSRHKQTTSSSAGHFHAAPKRHSQSVSMSRHTPISPSPDPSFVSHPPEMSPPLSQVPIKDPKMGRLVRRYERHPSRNKFFFKGHLLTGGDSPWAFIICFSIVLALTGVWFGTTCVWWWRNQSPAVAVIGAYMTLIVITSMLATAFSDPGILPRNLDLDPPSSTDGENPIPLPRDLRVRNDSVRVKYCSTCKTYRPPRASHCKMCDNCVEGCDHHCQWVNNCVGRRNYASFFVLLLTATLTLVFVVCTSALHLYLLTVKKHINFRHALREAPGSAVAFSMAICVIWPVAALLTYHVRLLVLNITTIEQIRNQAHKSLMPGPAPPNPFTHGTWTRNLVEVLCRPRGTSWLNASRVATEDKRKINPGMFDSIWDGGSGLGVAGNHVQQ